MEKIKNIISVKYGSNPTDRIDYFIEGEEEGKSFYWGAILGRNRDYFNSDIYDSYEVVTYINTDNTFDQELERQSFKRFEDAEYFVKKMIEAHHYVGPIIDQVKDFFDIKYEYDYQDNKEFGNFFEYKNGALNGNVYFFDNDLLEQMIYEIHNEDKAEGKFSFLGHLLTYRKDGNKLEVNIYEGKEDFKNNKIKNSFVFDLKSYNFKPHEYDLEKIKDFVNDLDEYLIP